LRSSIENGVEVYCLQVIIVEAIRGDVNLKKGVWGKGMTMEMRITTARRRETGLKGGEAP
jgi:hypothetical protein